MNTNDGTGGEDTEQGSMEAHTEALHLFPLSLYTKLQWGWEPTAHQHFLVPVWDPHALWIKVLKVMGPLTAAQNTTIIRLEIVLSGGVGCS